MTAFTPVLSLSGGVLIGLAAVLLMLFYGRIMGATGVLTGAILPTGPGDRAWRVAVLAGMASGPLSRRRAPCRQSRFQCRRRCWRRAALPSAPA